MTLTSTFLLSFISKLGSVRFVRWGSDLFHSIRYKFDSRVRKYKKRSRKKRKAFPKFGLLVGSNVIWMCKTSEVAHGYRVRKYHSVQSKINVVTVDIPGPIVAAHVCFGKPNKLHAFQTLIFLAILPLLGHCC